MERFQRIASYNQPSSNRSPETLALWGLEDPYFPLNSGCLNRDPCKNFIVIPHRFLGRMSSPMYIYIYPKTTYIFFFKLCPDEIALFFVFFFSEDEGWIFQAHCLNLGSS